MSATITPRSTTLAIAATLAALALAPAARADFRLERELPLAPGGALILDSAVGEIQVRGADRAGARILITGERDDVEERYSFSFEQRGADAVVEVEKRGGWTRRFFSNGGDRLRFEIEVPLGADVDISTAGGAIDAASIRGRAELHSSGGRIEIADVDGDVDAHTSGGRIEADGVRGNARLDTSGGAISARRIDGNLVAETSGGGIDIEEVGGTVEAHTSGGPVRARFSPGNGSGGSLSSSGGGITAIVDPAASLDVDAHTSGGRVTVDLPITVRGSMQRNSVRGSLNGGGPLLKLRSSGGSVRVGGF